MLRTLHQRKEECKVKWERLSIWEHSHLRQDFNPKAMTYKHSPGRCCSYIPMVFRRLDKKMANTKRSRDERLVWERVEERIEMCQKPRKGTIRTTSQLCKGVIQLYHCSVTSTLEGWGLISGVNYLTLLVSFACFCFYVHFCFFLLLCTFGKLRWEKRSNNIQTHPPFCYILEWKKNILHCVFTAEVFAQIIE